MCRSESADNDCILIVLNYLGKGMNYFSYKLLGEVFFLLFLLSLSK